MGMRLMRLSFTFCPSLFLLLQSNRQLLFLHTQSSNHHSRLFTRGWPHTQPGTEIKKKRKGGRNVMKRALKSSSIILVSSTSSLHNGRPIHPPFSSPHCRSGTPATRLPPSAPIIWIVGVASRRHFGRIPRRRGPKSMAHTLRPRQDHC